MQVTRYGCSFPNAKTNTVKFIAKADGYECAYVVGEFNNWKKDEKYKLSWKPDPNEKDSNGQPVWKMMSDIPIDDLIPNSNQTNHNYRS